MKWFRKNLLWINSDRAAKLGVKQGDSVRITSDVGTGILKAHVTDLIHPESVFMLHGFGHTAAMATRSFGRGVSDALLQKNITDKVGGSPALHDTFVHVTPA